MSGMTALGFLLLACGVPCTALGVVLNKQPAEKKKGSKKSKGKKGKKSQKSQQQDAPKSGGHGSLIYGGIGFALIGVGLIIADQLK